MNLPLTTIAECASMFIAIIALVLSAHQIRLSNKQNLFNRRLSIWLTARGLAELYSEHRNHLEKRAEPQLAMDFVFSWLTNNAYLCDAGSAAAHPLEVKYQKPFLAKLDELNGLAFEAKYAFKGDQAESISRFISDYRQLLFAIYQYQVRMNHVQKYAREYHRTLEEACEKIGESEQRKELYRAFDNISTSFDQLTDVKMTKKIEKQIRLSS